MPVFSKVRNRNNCKHIYKRYKHYQYSKSIMDIELTPKSTPRSTHSKLSPFLIKVLENTPFVNYAYDLFFDEAPDVDNVKEMLNLFALITTLFIGGVYGLIGSVTYDELHVAFE